MFLGINKYKLFTFILLIAIQITHFANADDILNSELKNPNKTVYDFTFDNNEDKLVNNPIQSYDKIQYEVEKVIGYLPRYFKTNTCNQDSYGNIYCNEALSQCAQEWDYEDGYSVSGVGTVTDYTSKVASTTTYNATLELSVKSQYRKWSGTVSQTITLNSSYQTIYNPDLANYGSDGSYNNDKIEMKVNTDGTIAVRFSYRKWSGTVSQTITLNSSYQTIYNPDLANYGSDGSYNNDKIEMKVNTDGTIAVRFSYRKWSGTVSQTITLNSSYQTIYNPDLANYGSDGSYNNKIEMKGTYICPLGGTLSGTTCSKTEYVCPSGYTDNGTNCKKNVNYTYYEYKCSDNANSQNYNWTINNTGGNCTKMDPDLTKDNTVTLDDTCNSSTPPTNNCKREKFTCVANSNRPCSFVNNSWQCSPLACNGNMECGYGTCLEYPASNTKIMNYSMHPIEAISRSGSACTPVSCNSIYEYDNGTATKTLVKKCYKGTNVNDKCITDSICDGQIINGKCIKYEYAPKIKQLQYANGMGSCSHGDWYTEYPTTQINAIKNTGGDGTVSNYYIPDVVRYFTDNNGFTGATIKSSITGNDIDIPSASGNITYDIGWNDYKAGYKISEKEGYVCRYPDACRCDRQSLFMRVVDVCPSGYMDYGNSTQCRKESELSFRCTSSDETLNSDNKCESPLDEDYYYHTYTCKNEPNEFGNNWQLVEPNTIPGCIDDTFGGCISFDAETGKCKRLKHTCPNGTGTCINTNGVYKCSSDGCDSNKLPCVDQVCDLALNDRISYCMNERCPNGFGVYEENNSCFIDQCPSGTFESDDGKCYE